MALGAEGIATIAAEENAHVQLVLLSIQIREKSVNSHPCAPAALARCAAVPDKFPFLVGQLAVGNIQPDALLTRDSLELMIKMPVARFRPRVDSAFLQGARGIRDHQFGIEVNGVSEAVAPRAGAIRIVEGKQSRLRLEITGPAILALEPLAERQLARRAIRASDGRIGVRKLHTCFTALPITGLQPVNQPLPRFGVNGKAICNDVNRL